MSIHFPVPPLLGDGSSAPEERARAAHQVAAAASGLADALDLLEALGLNMIDVKAAKEALNATGG